MPKLCRLPLLLLATVGATRAAPLRADITLWEGGTDRGQVISVDACRIPFSWGDVKVDLLLDRVAEVVFVRRGWLGEPPVPTTVTGLDGAVHEGLADVCGVLLEIEADGFRTTYNLSEIKRLRLRGGQAAPAVGEAQWQDGRRLAVSGAPLCHVDYLNGLGDLPDNLPAAAEIAYGVSNLRGLAALPYHAATLFVPLAALRAVTVADGALSATFADGRRLPLSSLTELVSEYATLDTPLGQLHTPLASLSEVRFQGAAPVPLGGLLARNRGRGLLRSRDVGGASLDWWEIEILSASDWRTLFGSRIKGQDIVTVIVLPNELAPEYERWRRLPVWGETDTELLRFEDLQQLTVTAGAGIDDRRPALGVVGRDGVVRGAHWPLPGADRATQFTAFVGVVELPGIGLVGAALPAATTDRFDALP